VSTDGLLACVSQGELEYFSILYSESVLNVHGLLVESGSKLCGVVAALPDHFISQPQLIVSSSSTEQENLGSLGPHSWTPPGSSATEQNDSTRSSSLGTPDEGLDSQKIPASTMPNFLSSPDSQYIENASIMGLSVIGLALQPLQRATFPCQLCPDRQPFKLQSLLT
jgi:hypothetical protein